MILKIYGFKSVENKWEENTMRLDKNELMVKMDEMVELMGAEAVLEELARAMSGDELQENLEYIDRMNETNLFD